MLAKKTLRKMFASYHQKAMYFLDDIEKVKGVLYYKGLGTILLMVYNKELLFLCRTIVLEIITVFYLRIHFQLLITRQPEQLSKLLINAQETRIRTNGVSFT